MAKVLEQAILEVISILPTTPHTLQTELSLLTPRADETVSGVTEYLEGLGFKIQKIFEDAGLDLFCDDPDISDFRHMQKNLGVRMNQRKNLLNENGKRSYEWIDEFRNHVRSLIDNPSDLNT